MTKKDKALFIKAYTLGWYHHGQTSGEFLFDVPFRNYNGDTSGIEMIAGIQYDKLYTK